MYRRVEISYNAYYDRQLCRRSQLCRIMAYSALLTKSIVIFGNLFDLIDDNNTESNEILVFNNHFKQLF